MNKTKRRSACSARTASKRALPVLLVVLCVPAAHGQELEPRAFTNLPTGLNFLLVGYAKSEGGLATDPAAPIEDAELTIHTGLFAYVRSLDLWGNSGKFDLIVPYSDLSGSGLVAGVPREREVSGFGDPRIRLAMNFYGAPALSMREFAAYEQDVIAGASVQLSIPMGQYSPDRLINLGSNRWSAKVETGFSKAFKPVTVELSAAATVFTDNDDYFGGQRLEQDPIYSAQANLSYEFPGNIWLALGFTYYMGGRTTVNGVEKDDELGNSRVGLTLSLPIDRHYSIKFNASTGVVTAIGTDFDVIGVAIQYRWGEGFGTGR